MKKNSSLNDLLKEIRSIDNKEDIEIYNKIQYFINSNQKQELPQYIHKCFEKRAQRYIQKLQNYMIEQQALNNTLQEIKQKCDLLPQQLVKIQKQIQLNNLEGLKKLLISQIGERKSITYFEKLKRFMKSQLPIRIRLVPTLNSILYQLQSNEDIEVDYINQLKSIIQSKKSKRKVQEFLVHRLGQNKKCQKYLEMLKCFINIQVRKPISEAKLIKKIKNLDIYSYPSPQLLSAVDEVMSINLIVLGQTGSGKTTLLNSLINYILQVDLEDNFRYQIIQQATTLDQSQSQTSQVTVYNIKKHGNFPPIKIIDTPGFGDTRGIQMDKKIVQMVYKLFSHEISTISGICFVGQASNARLTPSQKYVFNKIMELFGKDIQENIMFLLTFCDGNFPLVLQALQSKEGFGSIIPKIKQPWYLKFNNSAIFQSDKSENTETFWNLGMNSFSKLIEKIKTLDKKSLTLSKEVLQQRKCLENTVSVLQPKMDTLLSLMDKIRKELSIAEQYKNQLNSSKVFTYEIEQIIIKQIELEHDPQIPVLFQTNRCKKCNFTCHQKCYYFQEYQLQKCCAIKNQYCTVCTLKCHWSDHASSNKKVIYQKKQIQKTNKELYNKYCTVDSKKSKQQQIVDGLANQYQISQIQCLNVQQTIKNSIDRLKVIALKANTMQNSIQYIDLIIISEQNDRRTGYLGRVEQLKQLQKRHKLINDLYNNQNSDIKDIITFKKEYIQKQIKKVAKDSVTEFTDKIQNVFLNQ